MPRVLILPWTESFSMSPARKMKNKQPLKKTFHWVSSKFSNVFVFISAPVSSFWRSVQEIQCRGNVLPSLSPKIKLCCRSVGGPTVIYTSLKLFFQLKKIADQTIPKPRAAQVFITLVHKFLIFDPFWLSLKYKVGKKLLFCFVFQFDIVKHMRQDQITNGLVHAITSVRFPIFCSAS